MAVAVVTDASAAYLQRQGLDTLADGAALRGADLGATGRGVYPAACREDRLALTAAAVRAPRSAPTWSTCGALRDVPGPDLDRRRRRRRQSVTVRVRARRSTCRSPSRALRSAPDRRHRLRRGRARPLNPDSRPHPPPDPRPDRVGRDTESRGLPVGTGECDRRPDLPPGRRLSPPRRPPAPVPASLGRLRADGPGGCRHDGQASQTRCPTACRSTAGQPRHHRARHRARRAWWR